MNVESRQLIERTIVKKAIEELISHGFLVSLYDGDDYPVVQSADVDEIMSAMMSVDEETLIASKNNQRFGVIDLVYGNDGYDVICDNSVALEPFLVETTALAESIEDGSYDPVSEAAALASSSPSM